MAHSDSSPIVIATEAVSAVDRFAKKPKRKAKSPERKSPKAPKQLTSRGGLQKLREQTPSWVTSLILHGLVIMLLAFVTLPLTTPPDLSLQAMHTVEDRFEPEDEMLDVDLDMDQAALDSMDEQMELESEVAVLSEAFEFEDVPPLESVTETVDFDASISEIGDLNVATESGLSGRGGSSKAGLLRRGGGTRSSESAVSRGLEWLAAHQYPDGSWNFDHSQADCNGRCGNSGTAIQARAGATGLALLAYLGAGHTNKSGSYKRVVADGVRALGRLATLNENGGSFHDPVGRMYSHGIATMALCEVYAMTGNSALREPAQASINFICYAQDPNGGGWRYNPRQPGDTSVMGWQIGALKSGYLSKLFVPSPVIARASKYLDSVAADGGARYKYMPNHRPADPADHYACTAIGALCRMYLGAEKSDPGVQGAIESLADRGPLANNVYYNYYASQALFHYTGGQGSMWKEWNDRMRTMLVETQATEGHEAGSWAPLGRHSGEGGRLYTTALSVMTLEVYYRMLPIYRENAIAGDFEFGK